MIPSVGQPDARSAILASIRKSLAASLPFDEAHRADHDQRIPRAITPDLRVDLLEEFRESLEMVGAKFSVAENEEKAGDALQAIVNELSAKRIAISDSELVHQLVEKAGIEAIQDASREDLFSSDLGITSAQWAIAETGTLVLESGAEQHRLVSLIPPVHVCVLKAGSIRRSMAEILQLADTEANRAITFITGASRTSDIELTLAIGVHGPGALHVIALKDE